MTENTNTGERVPVGARLAQIDALRGIAALAVAWFHFTCGNPVAFSTMPWIQATGRYGWTGVEMFFVISGFIIPYSLARKAYTLKKYPSFIARRLVRLDPPYLASIVVVIALAFASAAMPGFQGGIPRFTWEQLALHLAYLASFFDQGWINPVYWSLAIEFQFYLLVGALFPLIESSKITSRVALAVICLGGPFLSANDRLLPYWLPVFYVGFLLLDRVSRERGDLLWWLSTATALTSVAWRCGFPVCVAVAVCALLIRVPIRFPRWLIWTGAISYSIYLLHVPVGGRVINLATRLPSGPLRLPGLGLAIVATVVSSVIFYRLIELPAQRWSQRIGAS